MAYYPSYTSSVFPPEKMDFARYDWVDFAFAVPQQDFSLGWDGSDDAPDLLRRLVANAHAKGKKVKVSVGGWTGSRYFSTAVSNAQNRQAFVNNIAQLYSQFGIDGIDIDWEYPGQPGNDENVYAPQDGANYLSFLQLLRRTLPPQAKISAATMTVPWADENGDPMKDVSGFAQVLDWILIMNYDTWGGTSLPSSLYTSVALLTCSLASPSVDASRPERAAEQRVPQLDPERRERRCRRRDMDGRGLPREQNRPRRPVVRIHLELVRGLSSDPCHLTREALDQQEARPNAPGWNRRRRGWRCWRSGHAPARRGRCAGEAWRCDGPE